MRKRDMQESAVDEERVIDKALRKISKEVIDGLRHGHFNMEIECVTTTGPRRLTIRAGKAYRFEIPKQDIELLDIRLNDEREDGN